MERLVVAGRCIKQTPKAFGAKEVSESRQFYYKTFSSIFPGQRRVIHIVFTKYVIVST